MLFVKRIKICLFILLQEEEEKKSHTILNDKSKFVIYKSAALIGKTYEYTKH